MNFKSLIHIIFSLVLFSCFSYDQEIFYNSQGICKIARMVFRENKDYKNLAEQLCFLDGLSHFCKEKDMKEGDFIGNTRKIRTYERGNYTDYGKSTALEFKHPAFPQDTTLNKHRFTDIGRGIAFKTSITMNAAMEKFVQDMIEKGKTQSVNQTNN